MYKLKVVSASKEYVQAQNGEQFAIECELSDGKEKTIRKLGFSLEMTEDEIKEQLKKYEANFNAEIELAKVNAKNDKIQEQANKTLESLKGLEL